METTKQQSTEAHLTPDGAVRCEITSIEQIREIYDFISDRIQGKRVIVIGGAAMFMYGLKEATSDIDLLFIKPSESDIEWLDIICEKVYGKMDFIAEEIPPAERYTSDGVPEQNQVRYTLLYGDVKIDIMFTDIIPSYRTINGIPCCEIEDVIRAIGYYRRRKDHDEISRLFRLFSAWYNGEDTKGIGRSEFINSLSIPYLTATLTPHE